MYEAMGNYTNNNQSIKTLVNFSLSDDHLPGRTFLTLATQNYGKEHMHPRILRTDDGKYITRHYYHPQGLGGQVYTSSGPSGIALCAYPYGRCRCRSPNTPARILSWNAANSASSCSVIATFFHGFGSRFAEPCKCVASTESRRRGRSA